MGKSKGRSTRDKGRMEKSPNLAAMALSQGQFRQRIVKSKVKYDRKRRHKGV